MALINCPECDKQVSDSAISCPHCGFAVSEYVKYQQSIDRIKEESEIEAIRFVERKMAEKRAAEEKAKQESMNLKNSLYSKAITLYNKNTVAEVTKAGQIFKSLNGWKDSNKYLDQLKKRIQLVKEKEQKRNEQIAIQKKKKQIIRYVVLVSILVLLTVSIILLCLFVK